MIKRNKNLIHIDLSHTNLSSSSMWHFGKSMRRAKNLRAIHLSGNPGITTKLIDDITQRIHGIKREKPNMINFRFMPSNRLNFLGIRKDKTELKVV